MSASGCFGYGVEYADLVDLSSLGAVVVKGLFLEERKGHPAPRIVETPAGMINAIGLQGIGVRRFVAEKLPELRARRATVIVNVCGTSVDEYAEVSRILSDADGVDAIELNISCPNIKEGGIQFGCSLTGTFDVVSAVRKVTRLPLIPKLTPNVTDVSSFARAAEDAGADAVSLVNTFLAMVLDVDTAADALALADRLRGVAGGFKIGNRLFTGHGPSFVSDLVSRGDRVFLDLKYHDIPNTVAGAVAAATRLGVWMVNVHASGGHTMMKAARDAADTEAVRLGQPRPLVIPVTMLTSLSDETMGEIGVADALSAQR